MLPHTAHRLADQPFEPPALLLKEVPSLRGCETPVEADLRASLRQHADDGSRRPSLGSVREVPRAHSGERGRAAEDEPTGNDALSALVAEHAAHGPRDRVTADRRQGGQGGAPDPLQLAL